MNSFGENKDHELLPGSVPSDADHIRFAEIRFGNSALRGNDVPASELKPMTGFNVLLHTDDAK